MAVTLRVENVPEEVAARERLSPSQVLEKVRSLQLKTPAESAQFVRQDRDAR